MTIDDNDVPLLVIIVVLVAISAGAIASCSREVGWREGHMLQAHAPSPTTPKED